MRFQHLRESSFRFAGASQASLKSRSPTEQTLGIPFREQPCTAPGLRGVAGEGLVFSTSDLSLLSLGYRRRMRGRGAERDGESKPLQSSVEKRQWLCKIGIVSGPQRRGRQPQPRREIQGGGLRMCIEGEMRKRRMFQRLCK